MIGRKLSHKFLLLWGVTAVLSFALVAVLFSILIGGYHHTAAGQTLQGSFRQVAAHLRQKSEELENQVGNLAEDRDIASITNLINKYQDKDNYQPLLFDVEKDKLARLLGGKRGSAGKSYIAVYDNTLDLLAYAYFGEQGKVTTAIQSYRNGTSNVLVRRTDGEGWRTASLPDIVGRVAPPRLPVALKHEYVISSEGLTSVVFTPIVGTGTAVPAKIIGVVIATTIFDNDFIERASLIVGQQLSILLPKGSSYGPVRPPDAFLNEPFPDLFEGLGNFRMIETPESSIGGVAIETSGDGRAVMLIGIDKRVLFSGIAALQDSVLWGFVIITVVMFPLGAYFVHRNLTQPVKRLMVGVKALSRHRPDVKISLESTDELGTLARAFNNMADTIRTREGELEKSRAYNRRLFDVSPIGLVLRRMDASIIDVNPAFAAIIGCSVEETKKLAHSDISPEDYAEEDQRQQEHMAKTGRYGPYEKEYVHKDGYRVPVRVFGAVIKGDGEKLFLSSAEDITQQKQAEAALLQNQEQLAAMVNGTPNAITLKDKQGRYILVNDAFASWMGDSVENLIDKTVFDIFSEYEAALIMKGDREFREEGKNGLRERIRVYGDGVSRTTINQKSLIPQADQSDDAVFTVMTDLTGHKKTEEALRHAQKMEAVGQLTGGVAHDFNNLLQVISGNIELLMHATGDEAKMKQRSDKMLAAVNRGASLTQRLLAFSRQQALSPGVIDVNGLIGDMEEMLQRTLGETVAVKVVHTDGIWPVLIDANQLDHALLNLALNARDAMPVGGSLIFETANVSLDEEYANGHDELRAGDYVKIAVTDSGGGMTSGVVEHAFEPFFTTKEVGAGSGLGLSMVYGFLKQSGGHVSIYSETGHGTTVNVYLPRAMTTAAVTDSTKLSSALLRGSGRILVVEDDPMVRDFPMTVLSDAGYQVAEAASGKEALAIIGEGERFDLMFTDVVLPGGMNGKQVADAAIRLQPDLLILYTTGYAENAVVHNGQLDKGVRLINKPYGREQLLEKVSEALKGA